jgi:serine/threonine-protein kinase
MGRPPSYLGAFAAELRRRRVFRALVPYAVAAFAILQVAEPLMHGLHLPDWVLSLIVVLLALGFPVTVGLSWAFDLGATGVERTQPAEAHPGGPQHSRVRLSLLLFAVAAAAGGAVFSLGWWLRPAPASPSIAVLAFADMSPGKDQEYLSDGIAEEILTTLSRVEGLRVAGRTSSFYFKGRNTNLADIGRALGVASVLEGGVRRDGNRIRVTATVVNVADGYNVWSESYDRDLGDILAMESEIASAVVEALKVRLLSGLRAQVPDPPQTSADAHLRYLMGRRFYSSGSWDDLAHAVEAFDRSLAIDPSYAPAWAGLAFALTYHAENKERLSEVLEDKRRALEAAEQAVALSPGLARAYVARGYLGAIHGHRWKEAKLDLERAIALGRDGEAHQLYGFVLAAQGRVPEAIGALKKSAELEPLNVFTWQRLGILYNAVGKFALAQEALRRGVEISPSHLFAGGYLAQSLLLEGKPDEALSVVRELRAHEAFRLLTEAVAYHDLGRDDESRRALETLEVRHAGGWAYQVAEAHAWLGDIDEAFRWLTRADEQYDTGIVMVKYDPFLRALRSDPRYAALLRKMNLPAD